MSLKERTLQSTLVYQGKIIRVKRKDVLLADGTPATREVVEHPGAVAVVALDEKSRHIYLVEQYRSPLEKTLLEIPAGKLDEGETPEEAALRELAEETGKTAERIIKLAGFYASPGYSNEKIHLFLALDLKKTKREPVAGEFLRIQKKEIGQILRMIEEGEIEDGKTILGISLFINRYNEFI
jgi:ADP-ribose pyrophosphatase